MALQKYNPKRITGSWTGKIGTRKFAVRFQAYMDDSIVQAEYDEAQVTKHTGAQGDVAAVLNCNKGAKITISLMQGSPSNEDLSNLVPDASRNYFPVGVLQFDDLNGTTEIRAQQAWIEKSAKIEFGKEIKGRQWTFDTGEAMLKVGSAGDF